MKLLSDLKLIEWDYINRKSKGDEFTLSEINQQKHAFIVIDLNKDTSKYAGSIMIYNNWFDVEIIIKKYLYLQEQIEVYLKLLLTEG